MTILVASIFATLLSLLNPINPAAHGWRPDPTKAPIETSSTHSFSYWHWRPDPVKLPTSKKKLPT